MGLKECKVELRQFRRRLEDARISYYAEFALSGNAAAERQWAELVQRLDALKESLRNTGNQSDCYVASQAVVAVDEYAKEWLGEIVAGSGFRWPETDPGNTDEEDFEHETVVKESDFAPMPSADEIGCQERYHDPRLSIQAFTAVLHDFESLAERLVDAL